MILRRRRTLSYTLRPRRARPKKQYIRAYIGAESQSLVCSIKRLVWFSLNLLLLKNNKMRAQPNQLMPKSIKKLMTRCFRDILDKKLIIFL